VARGPIGAAHARAGAADDGANDDQQERGNGGAQRQALESGHRRSDCSRGIVGCVIGRWAALALSVLVVGACSAVPLATVAPADWANQGLLDVIPIVVSSDLAVGDNRFLLTVVDKQNKPAASPDWDVALGFFTFPIGGADIPAVSAHATYMEVLPGRPGLYRADVTFPKAGQWGLQVIMKSLATGPSGRSALVGRVVFPVHDTSSTPAIGADAPATDTPTATTPDGIHAISTDTTPDPDFYKTSVKQALADHKPFMLIFATPAFCRTATCGPALAVVKSVAPPFKDRVTFIHVEPYQLKLTDGQLQPVFDSNNDLIPIQPVLDWGLTTEPYTFVVDATGKVRAKLEGIAAPEELQQALALIAP
jgi:hypothetical protein